MSEETRITSNPLPRDTRITADPSSKADTRVGLLPKEGEQRTGVLRRFWDSLLLPWLHLSLAVIAVVLFWQIVPGTIVALVFGTLANNYQQPLSGEGIAALGEWGRAVLVLGMLGTVTGALLGGLFKSVTGTWLSMSRR